MPIYLIGRHAHGDWGDIHAEDRKLNDQAVRNGLRLLSAYEIGGVKVYVITEWDRSYTTVLLASEY
ncbi:plasmid related protein [Variovorax sp. RKNM96]|nr:plasmid related protein [Variovorax sp. RKNM96]